MSGAGTVSKVTAFNSGAQANPFFKIPAGASSAGVTKETVYANPGFHPMGAAPTIWMRQQTRFAGVTGERLLLDFSGDFVIDALAAAGKDDSYSRSTGNANASSVDLALNGTGNCGGSTTSSAVANTTLVPLNLPLTTANALDGNTARQLAPAPPTTPASRMART